MKPLRVILVDDSLSKKQLEALLAELPASSTIENISKEELLGSKLPPNESAAREKALAHAELSALKSDSVKMRDTVLEFLGKREKSSGPAAHPAKDTEVTAKD